MISVSCNYCFITLGSLVDRANRPCSIQNAEKHSAWCTVRGWSSILLKKAGTLITTPQSTVSCPWRPHWIFQGLVTEVMTGFGTGSE